MDKKFIKILIFVILFFNLQAQSQTILFISPNGKDSNPGTQEKPFASLKHAQIMARKIKNSLTVYLRKGTYYLPEPIIFTSADSRAENHPLIFKNYNNEKVIISGGKNLKLNWLPYQNGIFQAKVDSKTIFDQLLVNGELQYMARYPNYDSTAHFLGGTATDAVGVNKVKKWASPIGGYVHALHKHEWGDFHYLITGKKNNELILEGGWQNNRKMGMHEKYRYVENIFEELDTTKEWFFDRKKSLLYFWPEKGLQLSKASIEVPQLKSLFEFNGSEKNPVSNIKIDGLTLTQTIRTFMENKEPLLRSDWTIYRGGAIFLNGTKNCNISNCDLTNLGGNAIFFNNYNQNCTVSGCKIFEIGASAICFVGDVNAVRSPSFEYNEFIPLDKIDKTPGPKNNNFPSRCLISDNLIFNIGKTEKQSAGVELSMCQEITVSHNTIYDVPRAGINVSEGTWGGHIIEFNDVFNTVKESGDHGAFNAWGRDRYWHPDKKKLDSIVAHDHNLAFLDVVKPIVIRNNRMRCDHGWDIDLDDGSSNYQIYNNLCLNGGLKLREGVNRIVENNILINNSFHPHVWFKNSDDVFRHNIVSTSYKPIGMQYWGKEIDYNAFPDSTSLKSAQENGLDKHSVYGDPLFINPQLGDFNVKENAPALKIGFKNFCMSCFGVTSTRLKKVAKKVKLPKLILFNEIAKNETINFMGAKLKNLTTLGEQSVTGMDKIRGVLVVELSPNAKASNYFQANDVILSINNKSVNHLRDFLDGRMSVIGTSTQLIIFRNQKEKIINIVLEDKE